MKKSFLITALFFLFLNNNFAQDVKINFSEDRNYTLIERTDLRRYDNNKYTGLVSREVRSFITNDGDLYDGNFYINEKTVRDSMYAKQALNDSIPSQFRISPDGKMTMLVDNGFPSFRSFPTYTTQKISIGDKWQSQAVRAVDPLNSGKITRMPIFVEYTYLKDEEFHGEQCFVFSAQWATRYGITYWDFAGDRDLKSAQGSHKATMYVSKRSGNAIVVRDYVDETFIYNDGNQISFKGTISLFTEYPPALDHSKVLQSLQRVALLDKNQAQDLEKQIKQAEEKTSQSDSSSATSNSTPDKDLDQPLIAQNTADKNKLPQTADLDSKINTNSTQPVQGKEQITVQKTNAGIMLTMENLQFVADSAQLLKDESYRLDKIASVLKDIPQAQILVEGHTASTGFVSGEQKLSAERARTIAQELINRGIDSQRIICRGSGAAKPIADNNTPQGKAKNRRVEITILE